VEDRSICEPDLHRQGPYGIRAELRVDRIGDGVRMDFAIEQVLDGVEIHRLLHAGQVGYVLHQTPERLHGEEVPFDKVRGERFLHRPPADVYLLGILLGPHR